MRGGQVNVTNAPLKFMMSYAWDLNFNDSDAIAGPKWMDNDTFDMIAKASSDVQIGSSLSGISMDLEDLREMLRNLLTERFQIKAHMEDRPMNAYTLTAVSPKLKKADPTSRTHAPCVHLPGIFVVVDEKNARSRAGSALGRPTVCRALTPARSRRIGLFGRGQHVCHGVRRQHELATGHERVRGNVHDAVTDLHETGVRRAGGSVARPR